MSRRKARSPRPAPPASGWAPLPYLLAGGVAGVAIALGVRWWWTRSKQQALTQRKAQPRLQLHDEPRVSSLASVLAATSTPEAVSQAAPAVNAQPPAAAAQSTPRKRTPPARKPRADAYLSTCSPVLQSVLGRQAPNHGRRNHKGFRALHTGVVVRDDRIHIQDYNAWVAFAPGAMDRAIQNGASSPEEVLSHLFTTAFPQYGWPPGAASPLREQWDRLLPVLADALDMQPPRKGAHLRVIK